MTELNNVYDEIISGKKDNYDGTLDFLVVSEKAQGMGVGNRYLFDCSFLFPLFDSRKCNKGNIFFGVGIRKIRPRQFAMTAAPYAM